MGNTAVRVLTGAGLTALLAPSFLAAQPAPAQRAQPVAPLDRFFYPPDHPQQAQGRAGIASVRLTVGPNGRVTGCAIRRSSGSPALDSATCRLLVARARFTPARNAAGAAMEDRYDSAVSWPPMGAGVATNVSPPAAVTVPGPPLPTVIDARDPRDRPVRRATLRGSLQGLISRDNYPPAALAARQQGMVGFTLIVGVDGRVTNCRITRSSGFSALDATTCRIIRARARFTPAISSQGNAMEDFHESYIQWTLPPQR